jgi:hypothetical protein
VDGGVVEERELARLHVDLDDADVPGVPDERVEDAEVGAVVGGDGRERVVVGPAQRGSRRPKPTCSSR